MNEILRAKKNVEAILGTNKKVEKEKKKSNEMPL